MDEEIGKNTFGVEQVINDILLAQAPSDTSDGEVNGKIRHCAFCLILISPEKVKVCGKCYRRAYCSRQCQIADWTPKDNAKKGKGQGHKSWCGIPYGEEDIDWKVANFEGKGLGLKAKRFIPAKSRIIVDGFRTNDEDIFLDKKMSTSTLGRSILLNHCCDANASVFPDHIFKTMVIYSNRDIEEGEEISQNYLVYNVTQETEGPRSDLSEYGFTNVQSFADCRSILELKWEIVCPSDCFCYDEEIDNEIAESKKLNASIIMRKQNISGEEADMDLEIVKRLLKKHKLIRSSFSDKARILSIGFRIAIQQEKTLKQAENFIREALDIYSFILHPQSELVLLIQKWLKDSSSHPNYLKLPEVTEIIV